MITKQRILDFFSNPDSLFFLWDEEDTFPPLDNVKLVEDMAIIFSLKGEIHFTSMIKKMTGDTDHIVIANNVLCGSIVDSTDDYKSEGIIISKKFWDNMIVNCHPCTVLATVNPILSITPEQKELLRDFIHALIALRKSGKTDDRPIMKHTVKGLVIEISRIYESYAKEIPQKSSTLIMREFTRLVSEHYKEHRDVDFYADTLHVSKRHLSTTIKKLSGITAFKCIQMQVLIQASSMLKHSDKNIKQIAMELNFDDTSHFCKYFRKYTGISPDNYRKCDI